MFKWIGGLWKDMRGSAAWDGVKWLWAMGGAGVTTILNAVVGWAVGHPNLASLVITVGVAVFFGVVALVVSKHPSSEQKSNGTLSAVVDWERRFVDLLAKFENYASQVNDKSKDLLRAGILLEYADRVDALVIGLEELSGDWYRAGVPMPNPLDSKPYANLPGTNVVWNLVSRLDEFKILYSYYIRCLALYFRDYQDFESVALSSGFPRDGVVYEAVKRDLKDHARALKEYAEKLLVMPLSPTYQELGLQDRRETTHAD